MSTPDRGADAARPGPAGTPPGGTPALGDLAATDALLDRLGAGAPVDDDLDDPAVTVLAELLAVVDEAAEVDGDVGRLMEVLGDRPLYLVGTDEAAAGETAEEAPISLGPPDPRVIDLTGQKSAAGAEPAPSPTVLPAASKAQQRWARGLHVIQQASLPAAGVLILLVLGGGVSAVVTGDPMAPVDGVTRVVSALPGVDQPAKPSVNQVERELSAAAQAMRSNDTQSAAHHLAAARKAMSKLPDDQQARLIAVADRVQTSIDTGVPPAGVPGLPTDPGTGGNGITTTTPPVVVVPATTPPAEQPPATAEPTPPPATEPPPTSDPVPPPTPTTTDPTPTDSPSNDAAAAESTPSPS